MWWFYSLSRKAQVALVAAALVVAGVVALAVSVTSSSSGNDPGEASTTTEVETVVPAPAGAFKPGLPEESEEVVPERPGDPERCAPAAAALAEMLERFPDPAMATSEELASYETAVLETIDACTGADHPEVRRAFGEWLAGRSFYELMQDPTTPPPDFSSLTMPPEGNAPAGDAEQP